MDGPRQQPERDADRLTDESDLPIYIFALIATIALTVGLFAWIKIDPAVPPPAAPARESRNEIFDLPFANVGLRDWRPDQPLTV